MRDGLLAGLDLLIANPSTDVYGSDLQMLESISAAVAAGARVVVAVPDDGPLVPQLRERGAEVLPVSFPVLRRANQSPLAFARLVLQAAVAVPRLVVAIRRLRPAVVYVNTVTLPWWLLAGWLTRTPTLCHLHEAENTDSGLVRTALILPLRLADAVVVISRAALDAMVETAPGLAGRAHLIYNGVPAPPEPPEPARRTRPFKLVVVGRLSPRKAPHLALEAVARLRSAGHRVHVELAGSIFPGYEWYLRELEERAGQPDLAGAVHFAGYCKPIWPHLAAADVVVAPSLREPFGNAVVEAQLSLRPVVATAALGHLESITDQETGLLVPAEDVPAMAEAIARLLEDAPLAEDLAVRARHHALAAFSTARYAQQLVGVIGALAGRTG